ncbi:TolB family protein [Ancylomarina euxinus]|nr:PD40 domain-containing protein [Ancylomarina euxinus]MCZ4694099.1 PD40 domain-containing protein [Ancylomarina euxinus]
MKKTLLILSLLALCNSLFAQSKTETFPVLKGQYMGQKLPGLSPELFAPNIISNGLANRDVAISPDGKEMYFTLHTAKFEYAIIVCSKLVNGRWTRPEIVPFATDSRYKYLEPALSYDGQKLFFVSDRPMDGSNEPVAEDIWVVDRKNDSWGEPYNIGAPVNFEGGDFFPSLTKDGTLYFTRNELEGRISNIYRSRLVDGKYSSPEKLPAQINCGTTRFNAYVSPDESFVVVPAVGVEKDYRGVHYYIVFRNEDDTWQEPLALSSEINTPMGTGWSFYMSPDMKYIFYMATKPLAKENHPETLSVDFLHRFSEMPQNGNSDIYWVDAKIIENLRPQTKE